jgi:hypothetical protein
VLKVSAYHQPGFQLVKATVTFDFDLEGLHHRGAGFTLLNGFVGECASANQIF